MITQEQINAAIDSCKWKRNVTGIDVCAGGIAPCEILIEEGRCDTLIKLFAEEGDTE